MNVEEAIRNIDEVLSSDIHYDETLHGFFLDRFNDSAHLEGHPELFRGH